MANSITELGPVVEITEIDSDWLGEFRQLQSIQFNPGNSGDILVVRHMDETGPIIFKSQADDNSDEVVKYYHGLGLQPFIDFSACTLNAGHVVIVIYGQS